MKFNGVQPRRGFQQLAGVEERSDDTPGTRP
jgi:hypothetical protein